MTGTEHVHDDLPLLLTGELDRRTAETALEHLRGCDECRLELVDLAGAHGALTTAARLLRPGRSDREPGGPDVPLPPLPDLPRPGPRLGVRRTRLVAAAAACLLVGAGAGALVTHEREVPRGRAAEVVALQPVTGDASGRVTMTSPGGQTRMSISTDGLPAPGAGHFYYAWLLDPATNKMLPLGVVSPSTPARFAVSTDLVTRYHAVDISLQADDGDPGHSATSVLRARY
ncbi:anti-sigma factor [Angustibacter aerolatus]